MTKGREKKLSNQTANRITKLLFLREFFTFSANSDEQAMIR